MCLRAGYSRISCASIRSHRHHVTAHPGQNGQAFRLQLAAGSGRP
jgi:hypothetical protein